MDLEKWAENLTKEVYNEWKTKYSFWLPGFKVFYSPVKLHPNLLILSYNPGGNATHFQIEGKQKFDAGDFTLPKENDYTTKNYKMSQKMRDFFKNHNDLLKESVILPIIFFRSKTEGELHSIRPREKRLEMQKFCFEKIKEIITIIKPNFVLVLGFCTYNELKKFLKFIEHERNTLYCKATHNNLPFFVIKHPTGARPSREDWEKIKSMFYKELNSHGM